MTASQNPQTPSPITPQTTQPTAQPGSPSAQGSLIHGTGEAGPGISVSPAAPSHSPVAPEVAPKSTSGQATPTAAKLPQPGSERPPEFTEKDIEVGRVLGGLPHARWKAVCRKCGWQTHAPERQQAVDGVKMHLAKHFYEAKHNL